jgi:hypothetical protein
MTRPESPWSPTARTARSSPPPSAYTVEAREESIEELSFVAYRRIALQLRIPRGPGSYEMLDIRQEDLDKALAKDIA